MIKAKVASYMRKGKPVHLPQRLGNSAFSIVAQFQAEYVGVVQYYRMAYNLHMMGRLKRVTELSLVKTLANKFRTSCQKIYRRYRATLETTEGPYRVLRVVQERSSGKPLVSHFGAVPLKWNKWAQLEDAQTYQVWNVRSELVDRLLAQSCELCGSSERIQVHHIRKLADVQQQGRAERPEWMLRMAARRRKTLVVCEACHQKIHSGRYDGKKMR